MISSAPDVAWPGYEAFFVSACGGPCYLIQVERRALSLRLALGQTLYQIVTERSREPCR